MDGLHAALAANDPKTAVKLYERSKDAAHELATGRATEPQAASAAPREAEVIASIEAARAACVDCPPKP